MEHGTALAGIKNRYEEWQIDCLAVVSNTSPVHVDLVSLLVDQLSGLFLIFFGRPKKNCLVSGNFWYLISEGDQFSNKAEQKNQSLAKKNQRLTKNSLRLDNFFLVDQKK